MKGKKPHDATPAPTGRFPANLILDEEAAAMLDEQTGELVSKWGKPSGKATNSLFFKKNIEGTDLDTERFIGDKGGASRFFYCAKASKSERNAGLEGMKIKSAGECTDRIDGSAGLKSPRAGAGSPSGSANFHPTVKPIKLMQYLCRLITPPGGLALDPFAGSGSTGVAAKLEGFEFIGIEMNPEYVEIAEKRMAI